MKRITDYRKMFGITKDVDLAELKTIYRNLMKEWHPDKFQEGDPMKEQAAIKGQEIITAYHFLVSISPETHETNKAEYQLTITTSGIDDFNYKGQTLRVTFMDGSRYEYFGVPKNVYNKFLNSSTQARFARRHIFEAYPRRKSLKQTEE
jgi:DnaJ-class molecular chaperone